MSSNEVGIEKSYFSLPECKKRKLQSPLPLHNKYQVLDNEKYDSDEEIQMDEESNNEEDNNEADNEQSKTSSSKTTKKKQTLPPIVLRCGLKNHKNVTAALNKTITKGYHLKLAKDRTSVFIYDKDEYETFKQDMKNKEIPYHCYTIKDNRTHAFVLTGLESEPDKEDIIEDLKNRLQIPVENVYKMKGTYNRTKYLITTDSKITKKILNQHARYVLYTKVYWERYYNNKQIIQCHRCQEWGHATSNCEATPACLKCAGEHLTYKCDKSKELPAKCANCNGEHTANSTECPKYQEIINRMKARNETEEKQKAAPYTYRTEAFPALKPTIQYRPAPPPKTNHWERRGPTPPPMEADNPRPPTETRRQDNNMPENGMQDLTNELNKLSRLIDINKYITLIKELNRKLQNCTTEIQKFEIFYNFTQQLDGTNN